jgi:hypothetical protein
MISASTSRTCSTSAGSPTRCVLLEHEVVAAARQVVEAARKRSGKCWGVFNRFDLGEVLRKQSKLLGLDAEPHRIVLRLGQLGGLLGFDQSTSFNVLLTHAASTEVADAIASRCGLQPHQGVHFRELVAEAATAARATKDLVELGSAVSKACRQFESWASVQFSFASNAAPVKQPRRRRRGPGRPWRCTALLCVQPGWSHRHALHRQRRYHSRCPARSVNESGARTTE